MLFVKRVLISLFSALVAASALAHHGVAWVKDNLIEVHGDVVEFNWVQPHPWLLITEEDSGEVWRIDLARLSNLQRAGFGPDTVKVGDDVEALGQPSRDPNERRMKDACLTVHGKSYCGYPEKVPGSAANLAKAEWAVAIEKTWFIDALKGSLVGYPVVSALHILGFALLFTCVVLMDLRLLGFLKGVPQAPFVATMRRIAIPAFAVAATAGLLMAAVRASSYIALATFWLKMALIATAGINFLVFAVLLTHRDGETSKAERLSAALSIVLWVSVVACGRALGFV